PTPTCSSLMQTSVHAQAHAHICVPLCTYPHTQARAHVPPHKTRAHTHTTHTHAHTQNTRAHTRTCSSLMQTSVHAQAHAHICVPLCTYPHTHTHTGTHYICNPIRM